MTQLRMGPLAHSPLCFWVDKWNVNGTLRSILQGPLQLGEDSIKIHELVIENGDWCFNDLSFVLLQTVLELLGPPPSHQFFNAEDCISWIGSKSG